MISLIVARDLNNGIGKDNELLYHIKEDMKRFKELTINHKIIMGNKTFKSLPNNKPLNGRTNMVLTKDITSINYNDEDKGKYKLIICPSIEKLIDLYKDSDEEVFIIGGDSIYKQFLPHTNKIYLTQIRDNKKEADTFFEFNKEDFMIEEYEAKTTENGLEYSFISYTKRSK